VIKRLSVYLAPYKAWAILAPILVVIECICEIIMPRLMAAIVDVGIANSDMGFIVREGVLMLLLATIGMVCGVTSAKASSIAGQGFGADLRDAMFRKIQDFSFADIDRFSSGSLITRITNDVNAMQMTVTMAMRIVTRAPVMLAASLLMSALINARLALVMVVIIPIMVAAIGVIMHICNQLFEVMQQKIDHLNTTVQEDLIAVRVVKAFVRAGYEKTKFKKANDELTEAGIHVAMRIVSIMPIMTLCLNGATVAVLYLGGVEVMEGTMLYGDLSSFLGYIFHILMSVMMVAMSLLQVSRATACGRRILEVLDTEPDIKDTSGASRTHLPAPRGKVEFQDVSFKYLASGAGDDVLSHLNFTVEPGQFTAIVGGTGTGKSSLVNLIPRFYDVTGGKVLVDGLDVREYPIESLRQRIGMVLQNNVLFAGTIRENLLWGNENATDEEVIQAAKDAQAYDFIMSFPDGFETKIDQGGVNVSGGQKQRLCIARAMLKKPAILILDDSTSAVDSATEAAIRASFAENLAGTTVIIIAQRVSSVQYADKILVLDDGTIVGEGSHDELLKSNAIYQEIYQSQQEGVSQ